MQRAEQDIKIGRKGEKEKKRGGREGREVTRREERRERKIEILLASSGDERRHG